MSRGRTALLLVSEIYRTILGESDASGRLCAIVRLTGCHRRCHYCDSAYAFNGGRSLPTAEILAEVDRLDTHLVLLTGGEPLLQVGSLELMTALQRAGYEVILETSGTTGAVSLDRVPAGVRRIVDVKTPGSGIAESEIAWDDLQKLGPGDELKFVCCDRADYEWSREVIRADGRLPAAPLKTLSPATGLMPPAELADWIVNDGLEVRFQVQLHRFIWPERERGV